MTCCAAAGRASATGRYYFLLPPLRARCDSAEAAAVLEALPVLLLRNTFEAALAARADVTFAAFPRLGIVLTSVRPTRNLRAEPTVALAVAV